MPNSERRDWSMETHNIALTALNLATNHIKECDKRDLRNEKTYADIKTSMDKMGTDISDMKARLAVIVGGIIIVFEALKLVIELIHK